MYALLTLFFLAVASAHPNHSWTSASENTTVPSPTPTPSSTARVVFSRPSPSPLSSCPQVLPIPRIVGGSETPELTPYLVALFNPSGNFACSGTLVNKRWVITAAHCNVNENWIVVLGGKVANGGTRRSIQLVTSNPKYGTPTRNENDIAALLLTEDAPAGSAFALLNDDDDLPKDRAYVKAAGYGVTKEGATSADTVLRSVDLPVVSRAICRWAYYDALTDDMFCAGSSGCDACQGDSGGPLFQFDTDGKAILVGVVSFGRGCARSGFPGVNTDVARYLTWLRGQGVSFGTGKGVQVFGTR